MTWQPDFLRVPAGYLHIKPLTGTYTLRTEDCGSLLYYAGKTDITVTIPPGLFVEYNVNFIQADTGTITVAAGLGVTIHTTGDSPTTSARWEVFSILGT